MLNVTIDTDKGWLHSQPKADQDTIQRKILKAQAEGHVNIRFKGEHYAMPADTSQLGRADLMGRSLAGDFKDVPPYLGATR
jgi:hypothetical protein